ncbi:YheC/YheD family endospore coat-associated protein [Alicyclobacillus sp. ALC3]|uniref:YheC/YheD family endospore coat-associated protein n=1 Tax=Alicyclobacillus sp. ALC3 TaxID=2796143 RepID=UPI002377FF50|nr:YheC/YheD family protein [Alicyclobacillus sp. ALC3]WDL96266.1 YheC/YheD family protein [Alicyclobacillus sp. ALC3]
MAAATPWIGTATTVVPKLRATGGRRILRPPLYYCQMARRVHSGGGKYVLFDPIHVNWRAGHVDGWVPADSALPLGPWQRTQTPLPDAIYENVFVHLAVKGYSSNLRKMSRAHGIPLFNPPLPDKWRVMKLLAAPEVRQYVPETLRLADVDAAIRRIVRWRVAYIKPIGGYGGMGVTRVEAQAGDRYRVSLDRTKTRIGTSRRLLTKPQLRAWLQVRSRYPYLVQQGISLLTLGERKVDFRVVCQRGRRGEWQMVGVVPKLAAKDGVVSNIIAGGSLVSIAECQELARRYGKSVPVRELEESGLALARAIGQRHSNAGIIGFDLGVDEGGHVWMIEANPKPARALLSADARRRSAELNADFALYLASRRR